MPNWSSRVFALRAGRHPRSSILALAITALLLNACVSPYVALDNQPPSNQGVKPQALAEAIGAARAVEGKYRDKVVELGEGERALSNSLLSLGALIVGLGVAKVHPSTINGAVLGAGAVYTIGNFNTDKHRAQVYIAGMKALDCAVDAVTPLALGDGQAERLDTERQGTSAAIERVSAAIGDAEKWSAIAHLTDAAKFTDTLTALTQAITQGQAAVGQANDAVYLATQRIDKAQQIATELRSAVKSIDRAVLDEIRGTENAVQAVPGILAGLQSNAQLFSLATLAPALLPTNAASAPANGAPSPMNAEIDVAGDDGSKSGDSDQAKAKALADAQAKARAKRDLAILGGLSASLGELRSRTVSLASHADRLSRAAALSNPQAASAALKTCQVDGVVQNISASPTAVSFTAKTAATQSVLVDGGNGNYSAAFMQTPTPGLTVAIPPRSKGVVNIVATDQTVGGGSYQLLIEDTTQQSRQIVTVSITGSSTPATSITPDAVNAAAAAIRAASPLKLADGSAVVVDSVDVVAGTSLNVLYTAPAGSTATSADVATAAFGVPSVSNLLGANPKLVVAAPSNAPHGLAVRARAAAKRDWGAAVDALNPSQIKRIQQRLCMPANQIDGGWGRITQAALKHDRTLSKNVHPADVGSDDMLSFAEAKLILALTDEQATQRCLH